MTNSQANTNPKAVSQEIHILEGENFLVCNESGDVPAPGAYGLFNRDTRFLSKYVLRLDSQSLTKLTSRRTNYYEAAYFLCNQDEDNAKDKSISVIRRQVIANDLCEKISVENYSNHPIEFTLSLECEADFADLFEVKSDSKRAREIVVKLAENGLSLSFSYRRKSFYRETKVLFSKTGKLARNQADFTDTIQAKGKWELSVRVEMLYDPDNKTSTIATSDFKSEQDEMHKSLSKWKNHLPTLETDNEHLQRSYKRSCIDLASLQIEAQSLSGDDTILAAGLPWFMTLFGRDSLISSYQSLILGTSLAERAVRALAKQQATDLNDFCDQQPGKILHEVRHGELTVFGDLPYSPYFGSIDSTMLFLILANEVYRWTGNLNFLDELKGSVLKAFDWIDKYGDLDGDGYVEYKTKSSKGLHNQGWKDSGDGIQFFNGSLAEPPIALCEVQGYVYDACLRWSETFGELGDQKKANQLSQKALNLKKRFNQDFWSTSREVFILGLDKDKRQIDSVCSNMGQLLWSGIVDSDKASKLAETLMSESMYSGWGVRTLSSDCAGFNPIGYHTGTVWPHDNSIIAAGLMKYGFVTESLKIIEDMLEAAASFEYRLPETFAGYSRNGIKVPARYPTSCSPQAWASGTPILFLRTMLGVQPDVHKKKLLLDPHLPKTVSRLSLKNVAAYGKFFSFQVDGGKLDISQNA